MNVHSVAAEVAKTLGLRRFDSVPALAKAVDCAVVATPTTTHFDVACELIEAGCDVLVEKPITAEVDQGRRLIDIAKKNKRLLQVGHVERYNPAIVAVAPLLHDIRFLEAERLGVFVGRSLDIDVLLDLMIHDLNLVLSLLHSKVTEVRAVGVPVLTEKVDITNVRLEMENGAVANLTASRVSQERVRKVSPGGTITTFAVTSWFSPQAFPATAACALSNKDCCNELDQELAATCRSAICRCWPATSSGL